MTLSKLVHAIRGTTVAARSIAATERAATEDVRPSQPPCPGSHRPASVSSLADAGHPSFEEQCSVLLVELARGILREAALEAETRALRAELEAERAETVRVRRELGIPTIGLARWAR